MKKIFQLFACLCLVIVALSTYRCQRNIGDLRVTDDSTQYIRYTVGGITQNFLSPADSFRTVRLNSTTTVFAHPHNFTDSASWQYTSFNFSGVTSPGTYVLDHSSFILTKGIWPGSNFEYNDDPVINITITEFGNTGEFIAGSFTGTLRNHWTSAVVTGSCDFRIKRTF